MSGEDKIKYALNRRYDEFITSLRDSLYHDNESRICMGQGNYGSNVVLIGEAPGADEVKSGLPFVGAAGKKLTGFLSAIGLDRDNVFITNTVKFRPIKPSVKTGKPINRKPTNDEISFCLPLLLDELSIIRPKLIVTLGSVPLTALIPAAKIGEVHGKSLAFDGEVLFPLYHPAAVIYNQSLKPVYEEDVRQLSEVVRISMEDYK